MERQASVWDEGDPAPLPPLIGDVAADVCVVGLGSAGLSAAAAALAAGRSVVAVDAGTVGGGASGRNGGFLLAGGAAFHHDAVQAYGRPVAAALYALTLAEVDAIERDTPQAVRRVGSLRIAASRDEEEDCEAHLAALRADGFPAEPYDGPEGRGLLFPADGALQPLRRCRLLAARVAAGGARLFEHSAVVAVRPSEVRTAHGRVTCDAVVVAVDGGLERLLPQLAPLVRTARAQMLATAPVEPALPRPTYFRWGWDYYQQLPDGRIALGGCRDVGGDDEWTTSAEPTATVQAALERLLRVRLAVTAPVVRRWTGAIAFTADRLPVLEEVAPRVWAVGAYSGTGNVLSVVCGRAAGALACGAPTDVAQLLRRARDGGVGTIAGP